MLNTRVMWAVAISLLLPNSILAQIPRYGLSTRIENHLLPAVSTGPLDPSWSPDGRWLAFSMRGDIWKIPVAGGEAIALTQGPDYHFEPAWSPDGSRLALTVDRNGNLEIGVVSSDGGDVDVVTTDPGVDVQPAWNPDGRGLFFTTSRYGALDVAFLDLTTEQVRPVATARGNEFYPAPSPDGTRLAYVAPVRGRLGSGGLWVKPLPDGAPTMVHYEETSYRARPQWTPDGVSLVYASDAAGSYDLAIVPAVGGNRVRVTEQPGDEFAPAVSPDGSAIAFVSNEPGPPVLRTLSIGGAAGGAGANVAIRARRHRVPTGFIRGEVVTAPGEDVVPARIYLVASDGRGYTPDGRFHRVSSVNEAHYFHTRGQFEIEVPAGPAEVEAVRGFEFAPGRARIDVPAGGVVTVRLTLRRVADPTANGWYSGDTHVHDLHEGRFGLTQDEFFHQLVADDLHVTNDLIHMDGTKLMGRWSDLTGRDFGLSNREYILRYAQEFRGSFGHVGLLGIEEFIMPLIGGTPGSPYSADVLKLRYLDAAESRGGIGGFMHPYNGDVDDVDVAAQADIPIHVALGRGTFFDVVSIASDEMASARMYYRLLNCGFRLAATGGTDNFSNVWRDPSGGTARTYARVEGPLRFASWIDAVRAGRTFATNGPLLFVTVDGSEPGTELRVEDADPDVFDVRAEVISLASFDRLEILVNGEVAQTARPEGDGTRLTLKTSVHLPGSGWIAARVVGDRDRYVGDNYVFAQTTPVHIVRGGTRYTSSQDAAFLLRVVNEIWERVDTRNAFATDAERTAYRAAVDEARAVYLAIIDRGRVKDPPPVRRAASRVARYGLECSGCFVPPPSESRRRVR